MKNRCFRLEIRLNQQEHDQLVEIAEKSGLTYSDVIRKGINKIEVKARLPDEYFEVQRLLANVANNINQIAHVANATGSIYYDQFEAIARQVDDLYDYVMGLR